MSEPADLHDVVIAGAGSAGLSAAAAAAGAGASVLVLEEAACPGGLLSWQTHPLSDRSDMFGGLSGVEFSERLERRAIDAGARIIFEAPVWDVDPESLSVSYLLGGKAMRAGARRLIVATGSTDGPCPFPGWTLRGVMGMREAMADPECGRGRDAVVIGGGDAALLAASYLARSGARSVSAAWHEAEFPATELSRTRAIESGVKLLAGLSPIGAAGHSEIETVTLAGPAGTVEATANLIVMATHRVPEFRIASLLRARAEYASGLGGWIPLLEDTTRSSDCRVFVPGDAGGIASAALAVHKGTMAGLTAAADLGFRHPAERDLTSAGNAGIADRTGTSRRAGAQQSPEARAPYLAALDEDVMVCRSMGVTAGQVHTAATAGGWSASEIRRLSRAGMGPCQGRMCQDLAAEVAAARAGISPGQLGRPRTRAPIRPVPLSAIAGIEHGQQIEIAP